MKITGFMKIYKPEIKEHICRAKFNDRRVGTYYIYKRISRAPYYEIITVDSNVNQS